VAEDLTNEEQETLPVEESTSSGDAEIAEANKRVLQAQAELENFRKRIRREMEDQQRYAAAPVVRDLLTVVDDLERAIAAAEKSEDAAGLLAGVKMVEARLRGVLEQHGCEKIEAAGAPFDPALHEAILMQPSDQHQAGTVMQVTQQGYRMHDRVVRPAQVIVAKEVDSAEEPS
jgi:molecular chaperone GrpE